MFRTNGNGIIAKLFYVRKKKKKKVNREPDTIENVHRDSFGGPAGNRGKSESTLLVTAPDRCRYTLTVSKTTTAFVNDLNVDVDLLRNYEFTRYRKHVVITLGCKILLLFGRLHVRP